MKQSFKRKESSFWLSGSIGAGLTAAVGLVLLLFPIGGGVTRLSYDLPFASRPDVATTNVAMVYLDDASHKELQQPMAAPWDRSLHARLIDQVTAQGAKAIVFDILFTEASENPAADEQLANAIKRSGRVILAGNYQDRETTPGANGRWEELPYAPFRDVAATWGNANLPVDPDYGIRRFFPTVKNLSGQKFIPWLPAAVASFAGASKLAGERGSFGSRWLNYHGPPGSVPSISYFLALQPDGPPPGFFKDKVVFVGSQRSADFSGKGKDEFLTPYAFLGNGFAPGVEIHAMATLNLMQGNWLTRLPAWLEFALVLLIAALAGFGLMRFRPLAATLTALGGMFVVAFIAHATAWASLGWFAWGIVILEIGTAALCSIVINSIHLYVEKRLREQELLNYQAMVAELSKAAAYVRSLLPARLSGEVETEWCFHPSEQLGGDAFGYYWIDADHLAVYLLDVCGHGVGAALLSVSVLNALRAQTLPGVDFRDPAAVLAALNRSFRMDDQNNLFFSAWYGVYRRSKRELVYASAGHPPALYLVGPHPKQLSTVVPLRTEAPGVGCIDEAVFRSAVHAVVPGSRLLVFSDGVYEIFQENDKTGTWEEFLASFNSPETMTLRPEERLQRAKKLRGRDLLEDDFSLVELRFN